MIIEAICNLFKLLLNIVFDLLPDIPNMPDSLVNSINTVLDLVFDNGLNILGLFIRINTLKVVVPLLLVIINLDKIYSFAMWVIKKLPFSVD